MVAGTVGQAGVNVYVKETLENGAHSVPALLPLLYMEAQTVLDKMLEE